MASRQFYINSLQNFGFSEHPRKLPKVLTRVITESAVPIGKTARSQYVDFHTSCESPHKKYDLLKFGNLAFWVVQFWSKSDQTWARPHTARTFYANFVHMKWKTLYSRNTRCNSLVNRFSVFFFYTRTKLPPSNTGFSMSWRLEIGPTLGPGTFKVKFRKQNQNGFWNISSRAASFSQIGWHDFQHVEHFLRQWLLTAWEENTASNLQRICRCPVLAPFVLESRNGLTGPSGFWPVCKPLVAVEKRWVFRQDVMVAA